MTDTGRPFDHIVAIDWSARSTPALGPDTIWVCWLDTVSGEVDLTNHAARTGARTSLAARLTGNGPSERTLVVIDVALGYPRGFASAAGLISTDGGGAPWSAVWDHLAASLRDDERNGSPRSHDRWTVSGDLNDRIGRQHFWGAPASRVSAHLSATKPSTLVDPSVGLAEYRLAEQRLRAAGHRPFSVWQLLGAGSVGSQTLTAIPVLHHLRHHPALAARLRVWPFETGVDSPPDADIVLAEAWPSAFGAEEIDAVEHPVKDARQVIALAAHLAAAQRDGLLDEQFRPALSAEEAHRVVNEEGWVLGVA